MSIMVVKSQKIEDISNIKIMRSHVLTATVTTDNIEMKDSARIWTEVHYIVFDTTGLISMSGIYKGSVLKDSVLYSYDNYGNISLKRFILKGQKNWDEMDVVTYVNEYDDAGVLLSTIVTHNIDKISKRHRVYFLYSEGNLEEERYEFEDRSKNKIIKYEYNYRGLTMRKSIEHAAGDTIIYEYAYNNDGTISRFHKKENDQVTWSETFNYNPLRLPVSRLMISSDNTFTATERYEYDFW